MNKIIIRLINNNKITNLWHVRPMNTSNLTSTKWSIGPQPRGMKFNPSKCKVMRFKQGKEILNLHHMRCLVLTLKKPKTVNWASIYKMTWGGTNKLTTLKIKPPKYLIFSKEISIIKCHHPPRRIYTSLVRPHLDYATAAWDPYKQKY